MYPPADQLTTDGYDLQFGTNTLGKCIGALYAGIPTADPLIGHWYLTELMMPALLRGKETASDGHARVITTSSSTAYYSPFRWDAFTDTPERRKLHPMTLYMISKLVWMLYWLMLSSIVDKALNFV